MQSILVATDLSPRTEPALWGAARLARQLGAALHVVHALELIGTPLREALRGAVGPRICLAEVALEQHLARAIPAGLTPASQSLGFESVPVAVAGRARSLGADLVILGPPAERPPAGPTPSGTLLAIIAEVRVPCLILRGSLELPLERVMLPLCATEAGLAALGEACAWLAELGRAAPPGTEAVTELEVLHVARRFAEWRELARELEREVGAVNERLPWNGPLRLYPSVQWGVSSEEEILRAVAEQRPSLVILGPHGRVVGEEADVPAAPMRFLDEISCSVLVMPPTRSLNGEEQRPLPAVIAAGSA